MGVIVVEIGELVFDGFDGLDSGRVAAAFQRELTRLLRDRPVPAGALLGAEQDSVLEGLELPDLPRGTSPRRLGVALARAVGAGFTADSFPEEPGRR
ncbi:hypothetical protein [Amycolatopsis nigrescens]|uniref:hypothetical protein n=1 Tax=Amycolatopsis nigrescens TaxID=381445 RepID=UPI00037FB96D|nr:hypothetical protein [Amycolatopsis nigrescens]